MKEIIVYCTNVFKNVFFCLYLGLLKIYFINISLATDYLSLSVIFFDTKFLLPVLSHLVLIMAIKTC